MRKSILMVSVLVAALGSGFAMAKGGAGSCAGGKSMGATSQSVPQGGGMKQNKNKASDDALKQQYHEREREQLKKQDGDSTQESVMQRQQSQEQIRLEQNLQP